MFNRIVLLSVLVLVAGQLQAELNFSPMRETFELEGIKLWRLTFENGTSDKASYQPPTAWTYSGDGNELRLQPPGKTQTTVAITKIAAKDAASFAEENRQKFQQKAIASSPKGSSQVKIDSEQLNPLQICGKDTYLVQLSYTAFGEKFRSYFLFLNLAQRQLHFQLTCRDRDYDELVQAFEKSLYSWRHLT
jgi:hypothetical protein